MTIIIEGVRIELTADQIAQIEEARAERRRACGSFENILKHWKFKKADTSNWADKSANCWGREEYDWWWWAEIQNYGSFYEVWMTGTHLKSGSFPGGWMYSDPESINNALIEAITKILHDEQ